MDNKTFVRIETALTDFIIQTATEKTASEKAVEVLPETVLALVKLEESAKLIELKGTPFEYSKSNKDINLDRMVRLASKVLCESKEETRKVTRHGIFWDGKWAAPFEVLLHIGEKVLIKGRHGSADIYDSDGSYICSI